MLVYFTQIFHIYPSLLPTALLSFFGAFLVSILLSVTRIQTKRLGADLWSPQSSHVRPAQRLGGIGIVSGLALALLILSWSKAERLTYEYYLLSLFPILVASTVGDLGREVRPAFRLLAIAMSGALVVYFFGIRLVSIDLKLIDMALAVVSISVVTTIFAATGVTNSFNIIDGLNGLASGFSLLCSLALAIICVKIELYGIAAALTVLASVIFGFLLINFPYGRLFLGDTGAYLLGHTLVWIAIGINFRAPEISAFSILLVFFWPVAETVLSIFRRLRRDKKVSHPDHLHFHQLVMRSIEIQYLGRRRRNLSNPLATLFVLAFASAPMAAGVLFLENDAAAKIAVIIFSLLFVSGYYGLLIFTKRYRRRLKSLKVSQSF
jgi:UDP-GlcNAc:undecaprenyl-phosphate GlcNAc-1-phosphate transferase